MAGAFHPCFPLKVESRFAAGTPPLRGIKGVLIIINKMGKNASLHIFVIPLQSELINSRYIINSITKIKTKTNL